MTRLHAVLLALVTGAGALAAGAQHPEPPLGEDEVSAVQLAEWIRARRPGLQVLDARPAAAASRDRLPGARHVETFEASGEVAELLVVYDEGDADTARLQGRAQRVLGLRGGLEAWHAQVLFPTLRADASADQRREFALRAQLSRYFGGTPRVVEPGAASRQVRSRRGC